jgi:hypothetical protein
MAVRRVGLRATGVLVATTLVCVGCSERPTPSEAEGLVLGPALGGWTAVADTSEFVGDELFMHINGGAELYHEYGFERLRVREYARGEDRVSIEIYSVSDSAYGVYTYARSASGEPVDVGSGGTLAGYYLCAWSGSDLVVVTAQTEMEEPGRAVLEVAEALAIPARGDVPDLMGRLPVSAVPGTETFLQGPLVMRAVAHGAASITTGFERAAAARVAVEGAGTAVIVVACWPDAAGASEMMRLAAATGGLAEEEHERLRLTLEGGEVAELERTDACVSMTVGDGTLRLDQILAEETT